MSAQYICVLILLYICVLILPHTLQSNSEHLKSPVRKLSTINVFFLFFFSRAHTQVAELTVNPVFNQHLMVSLSDDPVVLFEVWDTYIATYVSV